MVKPLNQLEPVKELANLIKPKPKSLLDYGAETQGHCRTTVTGSIAAMSLRFTR